jgi:hypothetical protein
VNSLSCNLPIHADLQTYAAGLEVTSQTILKRVVVYRLTDFSKQVQCDHHHNQWLYSPRKDLGLLTPEVS